MPADLSTKASLNTQGFSEGVQQIRDQLAKINKSLAENKQAMKEATKEADELKNKQKELANEMKDGATDDQKRRMQELTDQLGQVNARIGQLKAQEIELKNDLRTTSKELTEQKSATNQLGNEMNVASAAAEKLGSMLKTVIAGAAGKKLWDYLIGSNAEMEQFTKSFEVMLNDIDDAQTLISDMRDMAAKTPLQLDDIVRSGQLLMNYGVAADGVIDKLTQLGDLAGGNAVKLDRVATAYGQMFTKGKVTGEELRQMSEAGVPLLQALADTMGTTTAEVQTLVSKGKVGITELDDAITSLTTNGGKFAGMMDEQSKTMMGMLSTAKDIGTQFGRDVGAEAFESVKNALADILKNLEKWQEDGTLKQKAEEIGQAIGKIVDTFINLTKFAIENKETVIACFAAYMMFKSATTVINSLKSAVDTAKTAQMAFNVVMDANPIILVVSAVAGLIVALETLALSSKGVVGMIDDMAESASNFAEKAKDAKSKASNLSEIEEEYKKISASMEDSAEKTEKLEKLQQTLVDSYGTLASGIDLVNGKYSEQIGLMRNLSEEELMIAQKNAEQAMEEMEKANNFEKDYIAHTYNSFANKALDDENLRERIRKLAEETEGITIGSFANGGFGFDIVGDFEQKYEAIQKIAKAIRNDPALSDNEDIKAFYNEMIDKMDEYGGKVNENAAIQQTYDSVMGQTNDTVNEVAESQNNLSRTARKSAEEIAESFEQCKKGVNNLAKSMKDLSSAFAEQNENGELSAETILSLVDAGYAAALAVDKETGAVRLDAEAYRELAKAKIEAQKADIELQKQELDREIANYAEHGDYTNAAKYQEKRRELEMQSLALNPIVDSLDKVISGEYDKKNGSGSKSSEDPEVKAFREKRTALKHEYDMGRLEKAQYYDDLQKLYDEYVKKVNGGADNSEMRSVELELHKNRESDEDKYKNEKSALQYQRDMDEITEAEYYEKLAELRDKYLKEGTEAWKSASIEIHNYDKKLANDKAKEAEKALEESKKAEIERINARLKAKEEERDKAIAAIDAEVEARRRLREDDDIQSEIDAVRAQMNYGQNDEFSMRQLERKLQSLQDQQAEKAWERGVEDRKAAINAQYDAEKKAADAEKEALNTAADAVKNALESATDGISKAAERIGNALAALAAIPAAGAAANVSTVTNNSATNNNVSLSMATQGFTMQQLYDFIRDQLQDGPV